MENCLVTEDESDAICSAEFPGDPTTFSLCRDSSALQEKFTERYLRQRKFTSWMTWLFTTHRVS